MYLVLQRTMCQYAGKATLTLTGASWSLWKPYDLTWLKVCNTISMRQCK